MYVHFGTHFYGKVDEVPGVCHVATQFFHLNYVPLIPSGSHLLVNKKVTGQSDVGVRIGWSVASVFFGWFRAALMLSAITLLVVGLGKIGNSKKGQRVGPGGGAFAEAQGREREKGYGALYTAAGAFGVWWVSHYVTRAGYGKALRRVRQAGLQEELEPLVVAYFEGRGKTRPPMDDFNARPGPADDLLPPDDGDRRATLEPAGPSGGRRGKRRKGEDDVFRLE